MDIKVWVFELHYKLKKKYFGRETSRRNKVFKNLK